MQDQLTAAMKGRDFIVVGVGQIAEFVDKLRRVNGGPCP